MNIWLELLAWFGAGVAASVGLILLCRLFRIDLLPLRELLITTLCLTTFGTGIVRVFAGWSFWACVPTGLLLAFPIYCVLMAPYAVFGFVKYDVLEKRQQRLRRERTIEEWTRKVRAGEEARS